MCIVDMVGTAAGSHQCSKADAAMLAALAHGRDAAGVPKEGQASFEACH